jgi:hypothetical protein
MSNISALRAKLQASAQKGDNSTKSKGSGGDNASFPFWDIPVGQSATVRFLPDADPTNDYFWVKREVIKLPFSGVIGGDYPTDKDVTVTVPCIDMFGMKCPIVAATKHLWDKEETKDLARVYYKKRSWIFQGLVVNSPLNEENAPENPIRRFVINKSVYDKVYDALLDPDLDDMPTDYDGGLDFIIKKTQKGQWADYTTSAFSRKARSLSETERSAIDTHGLFDLKEALGAVPSADAIEALKAMLKDSMDGLPYDMESFGQYFRPYGARDNGGAAKAPARQTPSAADSEAQADAAGAAASSSDTGSSNAKAILERLRVRTANNSAE